jgi:hypothetical protein
MACLDENDVANVADEDPESTRDNGMSVGGWIMAMMIGFQIIWIKLTP